MGARISVQESGGRAVVVKRAEGSTQVALLALEADWLQSITHPGVVEFVEFREQSDQDHPSAELTTVYAGAVSLADFSPGDPGAAAAVVAATAAVLADLHSSGVTHGTLAGEHVIVGESRHPVLCSLARATSRDADGVADDVAALGGILEAIVTRSPTGRGWSARRQLGAIRGAIEWSRLPEATAGELAAMLVAVPGAAAMPEGISPAEIQRFDSGDNSDTETWRDRVLPELDDAASSPWPRFGAAAVIAVFCLAGWAVFGRAGLSAPELARPDPKTVATPQPRVPAPPNEVSQPAVRLLDVCSEIDPGDPGCSAEVLVTGNLIRAGNTWFQAGQAGDQVVVGDWNCDGRSTPALLRPPTGEVFVFPAWRGPTGVVRVPASTRVVEKVGLMVGHQDGCDVLMAVTAGPDSAASVVEGL